MNTEFPSVVLYQVKWTTDDLYEHFFLDAIENERDDLTEEECEELFVQMWNDKREELIDAEPPSEWENPYYDIMINWLYENEILTETNV